MPCGGPTRWNAYSLKFCTADTSTKFKHEERSAGSATYLDEQPSEHGSEKQGRKVQYEISNLNHVIEPDTTTTNVAQSPPLEPIES